MATKSKLRYEPIYDRILVKPDDVVTQIGRIIVPDAAKEKPIRGVVVEVGRGRFSEATQNYVPLLMEVGEYVQYGKYQGKDVKLDGEMYCILKEDEILLVERA